MLSISLKNRMLNSTTSKKTGMAEVACIIKILKWDWAGNIRNIQIYLDKYQNNQVIMTYDMGKFHTHSLVAG